MIYKLDQLREVIEKGLKEVELSKPPLELYEPIRYTLDLGGKRLRPALCLLATDMFGADISKAVEAALGIEIFHNFTLVHDDIMDLAPIRRGKETVYKKWNPNIAILSGDTMMALSYEYIMKSPLDLRSEVFSIFNKTAIEVCEGQQYDMNFELQQNVTIDDYVEMIRLKTAVLVAASLKIGAVIGKASTEQANLLYSFGEKIGIAFQLKDDLLDVYSDEKKFGKKRGGDILANKKTFLYLKAIQLANPEIATQLKELYSSKIRSDEKKISEVVKIFDSLKINEITKNEIDQYYKQGLEDLHKIELSDDRKSEMFAFANLLKQRDH